MIGSIDFIVLIDLIDSIYFIDLIDVIDSLGHTKPTDPQRGSGGQISMVNRQNL